MITRNPRRDKLAAAADSMSKNAGDVALGFISSAPAPAAPAPQAAAPVSPRPYARNAAALGIETKTRKTMLLLPPSVHARAKETAAGLGLSFNEFACQALDVLSRYPGLFDKVKAAEAQAQKREA